MSNLEILVGIGLLVLAVGIIVCVSAQDHEARRGVIGGSSMPKVTHSARKKIASEKTMLNRIIVGCTAGIICLLSVSYML